MSLHEIFKVDDQSLLNFISNYKLNLISPENIHDNEFEKFKTGLGTLLIFLKHKDDEDYTWLQNQERCKNVDRETANMIQILAGTKMKFEENKEVVNMSQAWENSINDSREQGEKNAAKKYEETLKNIRQEREKDKKNYEETLNNIRQEREKDKKNYEETLKNIKQEREEDKKNYEELIKNLEKKYEEIIKNLKEKNKEDQ